jgi:hypothetical protein
VLPPRLEVIATLAEVLGVKEEVDVLFNALRVFDAILIGALDSK